MVHRVLPWLLLPVWLAACPPAQKDTAECASPADCQAPDPAPCSSCPTLATALCVEGVCVQRGDDAVQVTVASLLIDRDVDGVNGLRFAVLTDTPCVDATGLGDDLNVLAAGQKTLSGGQLHQDLAFGSVPEGKVTVVALGTAGAAGEGEVLAVGCTPSLTASAPELIVQRLDLTE